MSKNQLIQAFLNAFKTWQAYVIANKKANKANNQEAKSYLTKAVFHWAKEAQKLKKMLDMCLGIR